MREMKESGLLWHPQIPANWEVVQLGRIGEFSSSGIDKKINEDEVLVKIVNYTDIYRNRSMILDNSIVYMQVTCDCEKRDKNLIEVGDIIFTPSSETIQEIGISSVVYEKVDNLAFSYHVVRFQPLIEINLSFKKYMTNNHLLYNFFSSRAVGTIRKTLSRKDFKLAPVIIPPIDEQNIIASYLDNKISHIDNIIEKTKQSIEEYKKYKQSLIIEAVTKGLDKNVKMKDSGVEWIGEIPEHWDCTIVSRVAMVVRGGSPRPAGDPLYFDGSDVPWITVAEVTKGNSKYLTETETFLTFEGAKRSRIVEMDTLLLSNSGATLGVPKITKIRGCINDGSVAFNNLTISQIYLYYVFKSRTYELRKQMQGYGQPNLNISIVKSIEIPLPTDKEQERVVMFLDERIELIDNLISKKESIIENLESYKKSLIYEVVTGKKEIS